MTGDVILIDDWSAKFGAGGGFPRYGEYDAMGKKRQIPSTDRNPIQKAWEIARDTVTGTAADIANPGKAIQDKVTNPALAGWRDQIAEWGKVVGIYALLLVLLVLGLVFLVTGVKGGGSE